MTRAEAIEHGKEQFEIFGGEHREFIEMAIKALETAPCIKEKCAYCPHCENCDVDDETLEIRVLEQEPKTGRWILQPSNKEQGERDFIWWKCSECGQVIYSETEKDRREFHAFCSRCGAKME